MTISEKLFQNHNGPKYCVKPVWAKIFRFIVHFIFFAVATQHFCRNFNFLNSIKIFQSFLILKLFVLGNNIPNVYSVIGRMQAMFNVFNWSRTFLKPEGKKTLILMDSDFQSLENIFSQFLDKIKECLLEQ